LPRAAGKPPLINTRKETALQNKTVRKDDFRPG
jgi:hypothetical protein